MTTPAGLWNKPQQRLATMLSVLEPFQTFVGVETAEAALARIHYEGLPEPADAETGVYTPSELADYRPCAIIGAPMQDAWGVQRVAEETFMTSGKLLLWLMRSAESTNHGEPTADEVTQFKNDVGAILAAADDTEADGLLDLPWQHPYLATRRLYLFEGPVWPDANEAQDTGVFIHATFIVEW